MPRGVQRQRQININGRAGHKYSVRLGLASRKFRLGSAFASIESAHTVYVVCKELLRFDVGGTYPIVERKRLKQVHV